jgi:hypothetical protein
MKNIKELREFLGEAMKDLKSGKMDIAKAKTISEIGQVIVNSAKVEVDFIKAAKVKDATDFISSAIIKPLQEAVKDIETPVKSLDRPKAEYSNQGHDAAMKKYGS